VTSTRSWGTCGLLLAGLCAIVLSLAGLPVSPSQAGPTLNYRFGFGKTAQPLESYDPALLAQLRAGMYLDWQTIVQPPRPNGIEYVQMLRVKQVKTDSRYDAPYRVPYTYTVWPAWEKLADCVRANPGALWLVGNEMDRVDWDAGHQDECLPEVYAGVYHEAYTRIKGWDPTAQVAIGGVCQVTPLRLEYLDRVLAAYRTRYGTRMPVDVWNVHAFVLREKRWHEGCPDCWGIDVPAGSSAAAGVLYDIRDSTNLEAFKEQIIAFRRWMRDHGERDKPFIVSEYGVLMPYWVEDEDGRAFTPERVRDFMYASFDYLQSATDPDLGCPADKDRLVQRWVWYSLDGDPEVFGGNLFDSTTRQMTTLGRYWAAYVNDPARMPAPQVNLFPVRAWAGSAADGMTLHALIGNSGSLPVAQSFAVRFEDEAGQTLGEVAVPGLRCCGDSVTVAVQWADAPPGEQRVRVRVDPAGQVAEPDRVDNELTVRVQVVDSPLPTPTPTATATRSTSSPTAVPTSPASTPTGVVPGLVRASPAPPEPPASTASSEASGASQTPALSPGASGEPWPAADWWLGGLLALVALGMGIFLHRREQRKGDPR